MFCSHLPASAGWTGMSTITNGGVMEPTQGLNGSMLASQPGMGATGYPTHWCVGRVAVLFTISLSLAVRWHCGAANTSPPPFVAGLFLGCGTKWGKVDVWDVNGIWLGEGWGGASNGSQGAFWPTQVLTPPVEGETGPNQGSYVFKLTVNEYKR